MVLKWGLGRDRRIKAHQCQEERGTTAWVCTPAEQSTAEPSSPRLAGSRRLHITEACFHGPQAVAPEDPKKSKASKVSFGK